MKSLNALLSVIIIGIMVGCSDIATQSTHSSELEAVENGNIDKYRYVAQLDDDDVGREATAKINKDGEGVELLYSSNNITEGDTFYIVANIDTQYPDTIITYTPDYTTTQEKSVLTYKNAPVSAEPYDWEFVVANAEEGDLKAVTKNNNVDVIWDMFN